MTKNKLRHSSIKDASTPVFLPVRHSHLQKRCLRGTIPALRRIPGALLAKWKFFLESVDQDPKKQQGAGQPPNRLPPLFSWCRSRDLKPQNLEIFSIESRPNPTQEFLCCQSRDLLPIDAHQTLTSRGLQRFSRPKFTSDCWSAPTIHSR